MRAFKLVIILLFCIPAYAFAFNCTSNQAGDFDTAAIWSNCNSTHPQPGDSVSISHTVTIPSGTFAIGTGTGAQFTVADGGTVIFESGAILQVTGYTSNEGIWDMTAGGSTLHYANTTGNCPFFNGFNEYLGDARIRIGSSLSSPRTSITSGGCAFYFDFVTTSGTPQDFIAYNLDVLAGTGSTVTGNQVFDATLASGEGVVNRFELYGSTIVGTLGVFFYAPSAIRTDAILKLQGNYFQQITTSASFKTISFNFYNGPSTGTRLIDDNTIVGQVYIQENRGLTFTNNRILPRTNEGASHTFTNSQDFAMVEFSGNLIRNYYAANINLDATLYDANYTFCDQTAKANPHDINHPQRALGATTISNSIWEFSGNSADGDSILIGTATGGPNTLTISGNIILPSSGTNSSFGTLFSALGNANTSLNVVNNLAFVGADSGNNTCSVMGETYASFAGALIRYKNNICIANDASPSLTLYGIKDSSGTVQDVATSDAIDYNVNYNIGSGAAFGSCSGFDFSSGTCGANDVNVDPDFVDITRNLLTFYALCSGDGTPTYAEAVTEFAKKYDSRASYDSCYDDYYTWVRAGFEPQNEALRAAGYDGSDIGPVAMSALAASASRPLGGAGGIQAGSMATSTTGVY